MHFKKIFKPSENRFESDQLILINMSSRNSDVVVKSFDNVQRGKFLFGRKFVASFSKQTEYNGNSNHKARVSGFSGLSLHTYQTCVHPGWLWWWPSDFWWATGFLEVISQEFFQCWNQVDPSCSNFYPHAKDYFKPCLSVRVLKISMVSWHLDYTHFFPISNAL